ncbi:hypothetical protein ABBQ32_006664 [Trebouxia sp. C0010 RCD-2024]
MVKRKIPKAELRRHIRETPFTRDEVQRLWHRFNCMDLDGSGLLNYQETSKVDELRCNPFSARIVYMFSEDGSGQLTFQKFINMMSVFSGRTSKQTKAVWAFALWDFDGDDLIGPRDIKKGLHMLANANIKTLEEEEDEEIDAQENFDLEANRKRRLQKHDKADTLTSQQMNQVLERIAEEIDPEGTGLSFDDFLSIVSRMPDFITNFRMAV